MSGGTVVPGDFIITKDAASGQQTHLARELKSLHPKPEPPSQPYTARGKGVKCFAPGFSGPLPLRVGLGWWGESRSCRPCNRPDTSRDRRGRRHSGQDFGKSNRILGYRERWGGGGPPPLQVGRSASGSRRTRSKNVSRSDASNRVLSLTSVSGPPLIGGPMRATSSSARRRFLISEVRWRAPHARNVNQKSEGRPPA